MKRLIHNIISIRKDLFIIFIFATITILLLDFVFIDSPELFKGGARLSIIISKLCISYISAFIFYFIVVHLKRQEDKRNIFKYLEKVTYSIVGDSQSILNSLRNTAEIDLNLKYPSQNELDKICISIDPNSEAPIINILMKPGNWLFLFKYKKDRTFNSIKKIHTKIHFLDTEFLKLIDKIEDCSFLKNIEMVIQIGVTNKNLLWLSSDLFEYFKRIEKLEKYADKNLKHYL